MMKASQIQLILCIFCVIVTNGLSQVVYSISTNPQRQPGDSEVYIAEYEGAVNVSIYCGITSMTNGNIMNITTGWRLINGSTTTTLSLFNNEGISTDFPFISVTNNLRQILVISSFDSNVNGIQLYCFGGNVDRTFLYGFRGRVIVNWLYWYLL